LGAGLEELVEELAELGRRLHHEFGSTRAMPHSPVGEDTPSPGGEDGEDLRSRTTLITAEIVQLEATLAAKDALLRLCKDKLSRWEDAFGQLAREQEEVEAKWDV